MIPDDPFIDGLLNIKTQLSQRAFSQRFGSIQLNILDASIPPSRDLVVIMEVVSDQLFKLLPFLFLLIQQLLILIGPLPLLEFQ